MGVDRSSLSSPGVARSAARTTGDGLAVVRQQPTSPGNHCDQIDDFGSCNLDSIHQGGPIFEGPTCSPSRQERMILSRIFSSGEPGPQLTWTAMIVDLFQPRALFWTKYAARVPGDTSFREMPCFPSHSKKRFRADSRVETVWSVYPLSSRSSLRKLSSSSLNWGLRSGSRHLPRKRNQFLATKTNLFVAVSRVSAVELGAHDFATQLLAARTICASVISPACRTFTRSAISSKSLLTFRSVRKLWPFLFRSQRKARRSSANRPIL